ncbi:MAG: hypothetical protein K2R98_17555 [Gemmataceae bacterium]|nr:hypothetical protein [Gemmataceae bacterium]
MTIGEIHRRLGNWPMHMRDRLGGCRGIVTVQGGQEIDHWPLMAAAMICLAVGHDERANNDADLWGLLCRFDRLRRDGVIPADALAKESRRLVTYHGLDPLLKN